MRPTELPILAPGSALSADHYGQMTQAVNAIRSVEGDGQYIGADFANGTLRVFWIGGPVAFGSLFPVLVAQDGGSDGSNTTPASFTYTVRTLAGDTLGTAVPVVAPRPNGKRVYQTASPAYGIAFFIPGRPSTIKLWDAGEMEATAICTT